MEPAVLALLIPVIALATGFVHALKRPRDSYRSRGRDHDRDRDRDALPAADSALADEVAILRHELTQTRERLDFLERLLAKPEDAQRATLPRM